MAKVNNKSIHLWIVNSKNSKKIQKHMKFFGIQNARVHKACAKFCYQMTSEELLQKNQNSVFFTSFFWDKFCFFLHELLQCPNTTKFCTHLPHLSISDAKRIHIFLNFLLFFWIYYSRAYIFTVFPLPWAPRVSKQHENLHAPCAPNYLRSHKIFEFFIFVAIFFETVKDLWPDGNSGEGHFYKDT